MKRNLITVTFFLILLGCGESIEPESLTPTLSGSYKLTGFLITSFSGELIYEEDNSPKYIQFYSDSTFVASFNLCWISEEQDAGEPGRINYTEKSLLPDCKTNLRLLQTTPYYENGDQLFLSGSSPDGRIEIFEKIAPSEDQPFLINKKPKSGEY